MSVDLVHRMMALRRLEMFNLMMLMFSFISLVFFVFVMVKGLSGVQFGL